MKTLDCRATRILLEAFHDEQLPVSEQLAVTGHLARCAECQLMLEQLRLLASTLQASLKGRAWLSHEEAAAFTGAVVGRLEAERQASVFLRARLLLDDMHVVYAGLGAAVATLACVAVVLTMMRVATDERPDSLAAMVSFLAMPGTTGNPALIDGEMQTRWNARFHQANESAEQDAVFALSAVVTREGRLTPFAHLRESVSDADAGADQATLARGLLDALSRSRFANEIDDRLATSNIVWLITRTTVRATKTTAVDLPLPTTKPHATFDAPSPSRLIRA